MQGSLTLPQAAEELGVHYMTVYRYVRTGNFLPTRVGGAWRVDRADLERVRRPAEPVAAANPAARAVADHGRSSGQAAGWRRSRRMGSARDRRWPRVSTPAGCSSNCSPRRFESIGDAVARRRAHVADEHRASAVANPAHLALGARFGRRGARARQRHPHHRRRPSSTPLPVAIAADLLRWAGFNVVELGADTPGRCTRSTPSPACQTSGRGHRLYVHRPVRRPAGSSPTCARRSPG